MRGLWPPMNQPHLTSNQVVLFLTTPSASRQPPPTFLATPPYAFPNTPCAFARPYCRVPSLCLGSFSLLCSQCLPRLCLCPSSSSSNITLLTGPTDPSPGHLSEVPPKTQHPHSELGYLSGGIAPLWGGESVTGGQAQSTPTPAPGPGGANPQ